MSSKELKTLGLKCLRLSLVSLPYFLQCLLIAPISPKVVVAFGVCQIIIIGLTFCNLVSFSQPTQQQQLGGSTDLRFFWTVLVVVEETLLHVALVVHVVLFFGKFGGTRIGIAVAGTSSALIVASVAFRLLFAWDQKRQYDARRALARQQQQQAELDLAGNETGGEEDGGSAHTLIYRLTPTAPPPFHSSSFGSSSSRSMPKIQQVPTEYDRPPAYCDIFPSAEEEQQVMPAAVPATAQDSQGTESSS